MTVPCKTMLTAAAALCLSSAGALAQGDTPYYGLSAFEGGYVGGYGGGFLSPEVDGTLGGIAGVNFALTDGIVLGAEAQGGATFGDTTTYDALMLGHLGYEVNDSAMIYGALGSGLIDGAGSYAIGGGAEAIVTDQLGVRGELLATGEWGGGIEATKATAGVLWHMR